MLGHGGPEGRHHLAAQDDVLFHGGIAQIQIAVLQAGGLVSLPAAVDLKGQAVIAAAAQDLNLIRYHLDLAGGKLGVFAGPLPDHALHADGGFLVQPLDNGQHILGLGHHLCGAVEVPQDYEGQVAAHLPDVLHPAHDLHALAHIGQAQLIAGVCTHLHHGFLPPVLIMNCII